MQTQAPYQMGLSILFHGPSRRVTLRRSRITTPGLCVLIVGRIVEDGLVGDGMAEPLETMVYFVRAEYLRSSCSGLWSVARIINITVLDCVGWRSSHMRALLLISYPATLVRLPLCIVHFLARRVHQTRSLGGQSGSRRTW